MKNNLRKGLVDEQWRVGYFVRTGWHVWTFAALAISSVDTVADGVSQITEGRSSSARLPRQ